MAELPGFFWASFWIFVVSVISIVILIWLFVIGNKKYSVEDAESHAEDYANVINEGHGGMTVFLWVTFGLIFVWTIYYFIINWSQFYVISAASKIIG